MNTPESILKRTDSLDPATTCRGITATGLPCRRAISPQKTKPRQKTKTDADVSVFYCWQHKEQAQSQSQSQSQNASPSPSNHFQKPPRSGTRSSIDTLLDRLGVLDLNNTNNNNNSNNPGINQEKPKPKPPRKPKKRTRTICCCFEIPETDSYPPPKPHPKPVRPRPRPHQHPPTQQIPSKPSPSHSSQSSQTNSLLTWIPQSLTPRTTSLLLSELAKPISPADVPGYIYIFWVTPETTTTTTAGSGSGSGTGTTSRSLPLPPPSLDVASSLLPSVERDEDADTPEQIRRVTNAIRRARDLHTLFSTSGVSGLSNSVRGLDGSGGSGGRDTIRLKIGRTSNVHRRLNQWSRQCSNHLTLIRYYPYTPSSLQQSPGSGRKVPHVHRVERLIHLELGDIRLRDLGPCPDCGKEHREWFEVAAEREALRRVDECIRRWVRWASQNCAV